MIKSNIGMVIDGISVSVPLQSFGDFEQCFQSLTRDALTFPKHSVYNTTVGKTKSCKINYTESLIY